MRTLSAALISAGAVLPLLAHAATVMSDPTDAGASVPAVTVQSAFDGYQSWHDSEGPSWQQLNRAVSPGQGKAGEHSRHAGAPQQGNSGHEHAGGSR